MQLNWKLVLQLLSYFQILVCLVSLSLKRSIRTDFAFYQTLFFEDTNVWSLSGKINFVAKP